MAYRRLFLCSLAFVGTLGLGAIAEEPERAKGAQPNKPAKPGKPNAPGADVERRVADVLRRMDANGDGKIGRDEAKARIAEAFDRLDANKDGYADKDELRRGLARLMAVRPAERPGAAPPAARNELDFDALDRDADGRLTPDEVKGTPLAEAFDDADANKDGKIAKKELAAFRKRTAEKK